MAAAGASSASSARARSLPDMSATVVHAGDVACATRLSEVPAPNTRRVFRLFRPYKARLTAVLALIALSAGLGMVSPFLLRAVLDTAIPEHDKGLLTLLVAGGIAGSMPQGGAG